jgi:hypothetical protein
MSANSYGIIVEGTYDSAVYAPVIRKLTSQNVHIRALPCGGKTNLMTEFPGLLRTFEYEVGGDPVEMAIVIRDADGNDPQEVEEAMRSKVQGRQYPFRLGVRFFAVSQAMDAWLLADVNAISTAVQSKGGRPVARSHDDPEGLLRPKEWLRKLLADHKIGYTAAVCAGIAQGTDLQVLTQRCPRFRAFSDLVDC